ncbi:phage virion morphogenesis protein [Sphingomonas melonis]|uniref:phage virion morphogenesis protein n=1 Tax=Sphingomonas melonis TaxID=152682 RepID=UPI000BE453DB|nr:phage virion morphogenesis protein [Sphingomonas melonis]ATI54504.1 phage virion morphogenesis protein [Sphingomonas melonis]
MSDLIEIDQLAQALLRQIDPGKRRQFLRGVASRVRKSQSDRIARQVQPDGSPFAPRKTKAEARKGRLRSKMMFRRLRLAKYLRSATEGGEAWVGFSGRAAAIASVHQEGLEDAPEKGGKKVRYPRRVLLGLTVAEQDMILDTLLAHVAPS